MKVFASYIFDRENETVQVQCSGHVTCSYGFFEVADFESNIPLTEDEETTAKEYICEAARQYAIPEQEPEYRQKSWN